MAVAIPGTVLRGGCNISNCFCDFFERDGNNPTICTCCGHHCLRHPPTYFCNPVTGVLEPMPGATRRTIIPVQSNNDGSVLLTESTLTSSSSCSQPFSSLAQVSIVSPAPAIRNSSVNSASSTSSTVVATNNQSHSEVKFTVMILLGMEAESVPNSGYSPYQALVTDGCVSKMRGFKLTDGGGSLKAQLEVVLPKLVELHARTHEEEIIYDFVKKDDDNKLVKGPFNSAHYPASVRELRAFCVRSKRSTPSLYLKLRAPLELPMDRDLVNEQLSLQYVEPTLLASQFSPNSLQNPTTSDTAADISFDDEGADMSFDFSCSDLFSPNSADEPPSKKQK